VGTTGLEISTGEGATLGTCTVGASTDGISTRASSTGLRQVETISLTFTFAFVAAQAGTTVSLEHVAAAKSSSLEHVAAARWRGVESFLLSLSLPLGAALEEAALSTFAAAKSSSLEHVAAARWR
jgi:hypothetical protein